jgi:hypothetical protein
VGGTRPVVVQSLEKHLPVVIVAGGPSVTLAQIRHIGIARDRQRCKVIAVNDAVYPCWFADIAYACDARWWDLHDGLASFPRERVSLDKTVFSSVTPHVNTGPQGFDPKLGNMRTGSNSGFQAVHLAAQRGAKKIVLVGYDYSDDGARDHWFGRHAGKSDMHSNVASWQRYLRGLTDELQGMGISIINSTLQTTISWLPRKGIDEVFG